MQILIKSALKLLEWYQHQFSGFDIILWFHKIVLLLGEAK